MLMPVMLFCFDVFRYVSELKSICSHTIKFVLSVLVLLQLKIFILIRPNFAERIENIVVEILQSRIKTKYTQKKYGKNIFYMLY